MNRRAPYEIKIMAILRQTMLNSYLSPPVVHDILNRNSFKYHTVKDLCGGLRDDIVAEIVTAGRLDAETVEKNIGYPEDLDAVAFWLDSIKRVLNMGDVVSPSNNHSRWAV